MGQGQEGRETPELEFGHYFVGSDSQTYLMMGDIPEVEKDLDNYTAERCLYEYDLMTPSTLESNKMKAEKERDLVRRKKIEAEK